LLRLYTFLPEWRIEELARVEGVGLREAKQTLAREVTTLAHGEAAATAAEAATRALFGGVPDVDDPNIPTTEIAATDAAAMSLADLFIRAGLVPSRGEARRKATEGALWLDGERLEDVDAPFQPAGNDTLLRFGKKRYQRIRILL
jgi:tyrosyl-tRNA synthetase